MSNRMSVLSRRLGRFAICFSVVTFCFLVVALYAHANNKDQAMFFVAILTSECFFATFFLWLAHGFAWAMIPDNPARAKNSAELIAPEESAEVTKPEALIPAEAFKRTEVTNSAEVMAPEESAEVAKPEALRPAEALKRTEVMKPAEEKAITPQDSPAKYTITGRRIL